MYKRVRIFFYFVIMFIIIGIETNIGYLFAAPNNYNTCSFCKHSKASSEKTGNRKCNICKHVLGENEYSNNEDENESQLFDYNADDNAEEAENESEPKPSDSKTAEGKYILDLSGVSFYNKKKDTINSELKNKNIHDNEYDEEQSSLNFRKEDEDSVYDGQYRRIRSLDEWDDEDSSNYDKEFEDYDNKEANLESEYDGLEENFENEEDAEPTEEQTETTEAEQLPIQQPSMEPSLLSGEMQYLPLSQEQQVASMELPNASVPTEVATTVPSLPSEMQYQVPPQNQMLSTDPNGIAAQYSYNQSDNDNMNINSQQSFAMQTDQNDSNNVASGVYGQMNDRVMTPSQQDNGIMNQQSYAAVVNETIQYLRNLGILDENRVSKMSAGMVDGECIICMRPKFVFQLRGQGIRGVCEDCLRSKDSYGGAFASGGIKGVLEKGVMSFFGGGNDNGHSGSGGYEVRSNGSLGGYGESGGGYGDNYSGYNNSPNGREYSDSYNSNRIIGNGSPSQYGIGSLIAFAGNQAGDSGLNGAGGTSVSAGNMLGGIASGAMAGTMPGVAGGVDGIIGAAVGVNGQQMVMNALGQLVPLGSDPNAPYGYVKDASTGQMRLATSPNEGLAAGKAAAAAGATTAATGTTSGAASVGVNGTTGTSEASSTAAAAGMAGVSDNTGVVGGIATAANSVGTIGQMVMNALGQLVPLGSDPNAPYGYVKDASTGQMRLATSPNEGLAAGKAAAAAGATTAATGTTSGAAGVGVNGTTGTSEASSTAAAAGMAGVSDNTGVVGGIATAANAATEAMTNATNAATGVANTAVNVVNNAAETAASKLSKVANSAEAIKNATQPIASLASSAGSLLSSAASVVKAKIASKKGNSSADSSSNSISQPKKKKKKKDSNNGNSSSSSSPQQQSTRKKKKR